MSSKTYILISHEAGKRFHHFKLQAGSILVKGQIIKMLGEFNSHCKCKIHQECKVTKNSVPEDTYIIRWVTCVEYFSTLNSLD